MKFNGQKKFSMHRRPKIDINIFYSKVISESWFKLRQISEDLHTCRSDKYILLDGLVCGILGDL